MKRIIVLLVVAAVMLGCNNQPKPFEFRIKGKIIGKESGKLYFFESLRSGDEVLLPITNGIFEYKGTSSNIYTSGIMFSEGDLEQFYAIVVEPGDIVLELNTDSMLRKSKTINGNNSIAIQRALNDYIGYFDSGTDMEALPDSIAQLVCKNKDNFASLFLLNAMGKQMPILDIDELGKFLEEVTNTMFRKSQDFKKLYSYWLGIKDSINVINNKAKDFALPDITGKLIDFNEVAAGKITLVENSGSWCGNSTQNTKSFLPVYEAYKDNGFEIVTLVCESKYDRWKKWVEKEKLPWITLIELENDNTSDVLYSEMLFLGGNYLVDEQGIVIAKNLSAETLNELLMKKFEPDKYQSNNE